MSREFYGFEDTFKALVVEEEVAKLFADPVFKNPAYKPKEGLAQQRVRDLHLFAGFDRYSSDDWIEGGYKNIRFAHADVCLVGEREEEDSDGNKQMVDVTLFQGPVLRFTFDAAFPGSLRVISRRMAEINYSGCSKVTTMGKTRVTSAKMRGWAEITTEAEPFNKEFLSFAQDPVAAMRILKPQAIMKICSMVELFKHPLIFVFEGAEMFAFLHTGAPTFALSTNKDFERQRLQVDKDIEVILKFLDGMEDLLPDSDA